MSRREDRESDSKRHRSGFDRESSAKRPRRDGKPATERRDESLNLEILEPSDQNQKHRRRVPPSVPLESPLAPDRKVETGSVRKESDSKTNGHHEGIKHSSDPTAVPRSRSFSQHYERDMAGQVSRSFTRRDATDRGWWRDSSNHQQGERETSKTMTNNTQQQQQRNEKSNIRGGGDEGNNNHTWRRDGFFDMESDPKPPARRRPSFREKKLPAYEPETVDKAEPPKTELPVKPNPAGERREERERHNPRHSGKPFVDGTQDPTRRSGPQRRDRWWSGSGTHRGREGFGSGRQGFRQSGLRVEKWKHDLFNEANRSPTPKNEDDQIAKVEALLSS